MNKKIIISLVGLVIVVGFLLYNLNQRLISDSNDTNEDIQNEIKVKVFDLSPGQLVTSPLNIKGEARGVWYFEASFPVFIYDANGNQLGVGVAQAQSDWMTEDFVPFEVSINYAQPATETGKVVFQKDNPSGLPEFDESLSINVKFSN